VIVMRRCFTQLANPYQHSCSTEAKTACQEMIIEHLQANTLASGNWCYGLGV